MMDPGHFRKVMGHFVSGVTVVTGRIGLEEPFGLTASSFTSVSLDPLLVLVSVGHTSATLPRLLEAGTFAVNVLSEAQQELAYRFAGTDRGGRFDGLVWNPGPATGSPLLAGSLAWMECRLWRSVTAGDHDLLIGEVVGCECSPGDPLVYFRGGFHRLAT
jgi:flavin reductase (DIM6/NTAB) family NADH-FMN oxidoreductase RutF